MSEDEQNELARLIKLFFENNLEDQMQYLTDSLKEAILIIEQWQLDERNKWQKENNY